MQGFGMRLSTVFMAGLLGVFCDARLEAGTIVQINTSLGNIKVKLNDEVAPETVDNFLNYVIDGDYTNTLIHRSVPGFIVQGGGFNTTGAQIAADPPVVNEFNLPNVTGTIAMAKVGGDPNSATNQWFFNLADNRENLDNQNGGFTVFGHVIEGMSIVNQIAALPRFAFGGAFGELPLRDYTSADYNSNVPLENENLIIINSVQTIGTFTTTWHNGDIATDATNDGSVSPHDLLVQIDAFHRNGFRELDTPLVGPYFIDVNQNGMFDADDIERTINAINNPGLAGAGLLADFESSGSLQFAAVPEPAGAVLAALSLAALLAFGRWRR